jgi:hypothetical protein
MVYNIYYTGGCVGLTALPPSVSRADCLENVESLTSHNPIGLHGLLRGSLYFFFIFTTRILPSCHYVSNKRFLLLGFQHWACHAHDSTRPEGNQGNRLPGTFQGQYGSIILIYIIKIIVVYYLHSPVKMLRFKAVHVCVISRQYTKLVCIRLECA